MSSEIVELLQFEHVSLGVLIWTTWSVREMKELGKMATDSLNLYYLSSTPMGIEIVNFI